MLLERKLDSLVKLVIRKIFKPPAN